ncbi:MAG: hypothetical protein KIT87_24850 [Anaerolineae bacterium]|nr:hypothetical protein [Anaerolineae bacterium]
MNLHDTGEGAAWTVEPLAFQLRSPLHIGWRKVGNLMQTRPYVPARNLWGALTAALTRAEAAQQEQAAAPEDYNQMGQRVAESLVFTYLFPALTADPAQALYPWLTAGGLVYGEEGLAAERFDYLCLDSYASTAITVGQNAAETGSLHETEMLRPRTRPLAGTPLAGSFGAAADELGVPVYLVGYALVKGEGPAGWRGALERLQIGGERRYGWGALRQVETPPQPGNALFGRYHLSEATTPRPVLEARTPGPLLAHTLAADFNGAAPLAGVSGPVEPVVGRETCIDERPGFGAKLLAARICWAPGATLDQGQRVAVGEDGIWRGAV